jgi:hypothetical protein
MVLFTGVDMTEHYLYNTTEATAVILDINTFGGRQETGDLAVLTPCGGSRVLRRQVSIVE